MAEWCFDVANAAELDMKPRGDVFALDNLVRGDEIHGRISVTCPANLVKTSSLVSQLEARGIEFVWLKKD